VAPVKPKQANPFKIDWFMNSKADLQLQVAEVLGQGGFGEVFRGFDLQLGREVALKYFDKRAVKDSESRKLFQSEVDLLARLEHPNVIRILRLAQNESKLYLVMEYWGKTTLLQHVQQKHVSAEETRSVMRGVVEAVRYLHSRHVYHRDIKAENVMLARRHGQLVPCLIDFGLAAEAQPGDYRGEVCGTTSYMSPEMLQREPYLCGPNDIWQVGVLFYFLLKKSFPFGCSRG
jgi:serine/threonine protein kinase